MIWTWYVLCVLPVAWFLQLCVHEASHLFAGWYFEGLTPTGFYPYPHKHEGRWYFARYTMGPPRVPGWDVEAWGEYQSPFPNVRHIAPVWGASIVLLGSVLAVLLVEPDRSVWCLPTLVCSIVDIFFFWYSYFFGSEQSDGKRWRKRDE